MRFFRTLWQSYLDLKLQRKLALALVLIVFIPAIFTVIFFYNRLYGMVISETINDEQNSVASAVPLLNDVLDSIIDVSQEVTNLPLYRELFFSPVNQPVHNLLDSEKGAAFRDEVNSLLSSSPADKICIYLDIPEEDLFSENTDPSVAAMFGTVKGRRSYWRGILSCSEEHSIFCPPFYLGDQEKKNYGDEAYIRSTTIYYKGSAVKAYIAYYYSEDCYTDILKNSIVLDGSVSYLINDRDSVVATTDDSLMGIYWLSYSNIEASFMSSDSFVPRQILGKNVYAAYHIIGKPRWFLVTMLPEKPMIHIAMISIIQLALVYIGLMILAFFIASFISISITGRISAVVERMNAVREEPPVPLEKSASHDEIGDLINTYNYMTERMDQLLIKQALDAEDLRIAEFNSLQSQINPHFLYNTMDMINWMAVQGRTDEISNAVQKLSRFYRLTLSRKSTISTIAEESEHVSIYVDLQNMRYHDSISFILDIPDELNKYPIPRLTLQPVIENAIRHGILEKEDKTGTIVLTGWMEDDDIILLVSDDGVGISPEVLGKILSGSGKSTSGGNNIAVYNTHRRLQLLYGNKYGLRYTSTVGKGTEVEIRIPASS